MTWVLSGCLGSKGRRGAAAAKSNLPRCVSLLIQGKLWHPGCCFWVRVKASDFMPQREQVFWLGLLAETPSVQDLVLLPASLMQASKNPVVLQADTSFTRQHMLHAAQP